MSTISDDTAILSDFEIENEDDVIDYISEFLNKLPIYVRSAAKVFLNNLSTEAIIDLIRENLLEEHVQNSIYRKEE